MLKKTLLTALLLGASLGALAQSPAPAAPATPPATTLTPAQKAALEKQNTQMTQASLRIAQMVDQGQFGQVWDQSSSVTRQIIQRADFVQSVGADRARLGIASGRKLQSITRTASKGGKVPAGLYVNVSYATHFAKAQKPVRELISFHLDSDKVWRVAGYTLR
ncbi:hypothetical protein ACVWWQ_001934 [Rhodanobacter sp. TND4EL1]